MDLSEVITRSRWLHQGSIGEANNRLYTLYAVTYKDHLVKHPMYISGQWSEDTVLRTFLDTFDDPNGKKYRVTPTKIRPGHLPLIPRRQRYVRLDLAPLSQHIVSSSHCPLPCPIPLTKPLNARRQGWLGNSTGVSELLRGSELHGGGRPLLRFADEVGLGPASEEKSHRATHRDALRRRSV